MYRPQSEMNPGLWSGNTIVKRCEWGELALNHGKSAQTKLYDALQDASRGLSPRTVFFHQAVAKYLGLNITDHKCLDIVLGQGRATAGQLAELTGLTTGAITNVINRLEKAGFVRRAKDPNDRRIVYVEPVPERLQPLADVYLRRSLKP